MLSAEAALLRLLKYLSITLVGSIVCVEETPF